ncbi:MAG: aldo/keto reductase [Anaerolineae bacterium]|nr:aldo/keto reductase [Anaerolineae bacterium]
MSLVAHTPITRLGLGLAALGRPGYINLGHGADLGYVYDAAAMQTHAHTVLDMAWELGIRYFDAARSYGRAEQFLGTWLTARQISPDQVTVGSKWGYTYTADWQVEAEHHEIKEHSLAVLQRQIGESRVHLGSYLKLYQIHSATLESGVLDNRPVLDELARLRTSGLAVGLSLSGPRQAESLAKAMTVRYDGECLFAAAQLTFNLLETSVGAAAAEAHAAGFIIIVKEAVANGRLTPRHNDPAFTPQKAQLETIAAAYHTTLDALSLAFVLAQPWAGVVLSGATTPEQLQANAAALSLSIPPEAWPNLAEPPDQYWHTRSQLPWN